MVAVRASVDRAKPRQARSREGAGAVQGPAVGAWVWFMASVALQDHAGDDPARDLLLDPLAVAVLREVLAGID
jgi:hypothetical protein